MNKVKVEGNRKNGWTVEATIAHIGISLGTDTLIEMWIAGGDQCYHMNRMSDAKFRFYFVTRQHAREWAKLINNIKHEEQA